MLFDTSIDIQLLLAFILYIYTCIISILTLYNNIVFIYFVYTTLVFNSLQLFIIHYYKYCR